MCRLAQTTYKTPSTIQEQSSPSQGSFCFASPIADQSSPLATFLHQLSHATYESPHPNTESAQAAQPGAETQVPSPDVQTGPTPFQDFMRYLTQATYHSPGAKADKAQAGMTSRLNHTGADSCTDPALNMVAAKALESPGMLALPTHAAFCQDTPARLHGSPMHPGANLWQPRRNSCVPRQSCPQTLACHLQFKLLDLSSTLTIPYSSDPHF